MLMIIPNGGEYALLLWTCILLRITYVCLDPALLDISGFTELKHTLRTLKPQLVVAQRQGYPGCRVGAAAASAHLRLPLRLPDSRLAISGRRGYQWRELFS